MNAGWIVLTLALANDHLSAALDCTDLDAAKANVEKAKEFLDQIREAAAQEILKEESE